MLNDTERRALCAIADVLIPAYGKMPSFSQPGGHERHVDRILELRPELLGDLKAALALVDMEANGADAAQALNEGHPDAIGLIGLVASSAYYLDAGVRELMGYPGQVQRPPTDDEDYDYEDLLQPVRDRGAIFRPTPDE